MIAMAAALQALSAAFLLLLLLVPHACMAAMPPSKLLQSKCALYAAGDRPSYSFCLRTLRADSASAIAAERGLAAIAARIARDTAKATAAKIARLQGAETMPARRDGLAKCAAEYAVAVRRLGRAARDVARGGASELQEALTLLGEVTGAPDRCQFAFEAATGRHGSPLAAADQELDDIVGLAIVILPTSPPASTRS